MVEFLIGLILSFLVLSLLVSSFKLVEVNLYNQSSQDLISSLQLHQILNVATNIDVAADEINFDYLDESRRLHLVNNKIILKPGTVIYYLKVMEVNFYEEDEKIYVKLIRKSGDSLFLIGTN